MWNVRPNADHSHQTWCPTNGRTWMIPWECSPERQASGRSATRLGLQSHPNGRSGPPGRLQGTGEVCLVRRDTAKSCATVTHRRHEPLA